MEGIEPIMGDLSGMDAVSAGMGNAAGAAAFGFMMIMWIVGLVVLVMVLIGMWKLFVKAGQPGWAAIIPFYNYYVMLKIVGRPGWWLVFLLIPPVLPILLGLDLAKAFGKDMLFGILLFLFAPIFYLILGFGSAEYQGPVA